jgi:hypothetical protein
LVIDVAGEAERTLLATPIPEGPENTTSFRFDAALLGRGLNALKAARLLCEEGFWEIAAGAVRQVFDLVLDAEAVSRHPDRHAAISRYVGFGLLQRLRRERAYLAYEVKMGRPVDTERAEILDTMLLRGFKGLRGPKGGWLPTWTGKKSRDLAKASEHGLRLDEYEILYADWSDETHAAPAAVFASVFQTDEDFDALIQSELLRSAEILSSAMNQLLELWHLLPEVPNPNPNDERRWRESMLVWIAALRTELESPEVSESGEPRC